MPTPLFIGRARLLEGARQAVESGLSVHLVGESGAGKTALARRIAPDAVFVEHPSPPSEVLVTLLGQAYKRGWWTPPPSARGQKTDAESDDDDDDLDDAALAKVIRKMGQKAAIEATAGAFRVASPKAVIIVDNFDAAPLAVVRLLRALGECAAIVAVGTSVSKAHQKPFLFHCTRLEVKRLSARETEELARRLIEPHPVPQKERARLIRHLVEESQGLPSVVHELVFRAVGRGELSLGSLRRDAEVNGLKTIDMTPALAFVMCLVMMLRGVSRGWVDADVRVFLAASGGVFMLVRLFAARLGTKRRS